MARVTYVGENATHEWLCKLAQLPGQVWIENQKGQLVIVHEFEDQRTEDSRGLRKTVGLSEVLPDLVSDQTAPAAVHSVVELDEE